MCRYWALWQPSGVSGKMRDTGHGHAAAQHLLSRPSGQHRHLLVRIRTLRPAHTTLVSAVSATMWIIDNACRNSSCSSLTQFSDSSCKSSPVTIMKITPGAEVEDTEAWEPTASDHGDVLYEIGGRKISSLWWSPDPLLPVPGRSPSVGRYMVARRRVLPGEQVFRDTPAVIGPDNSSVPLCTVCWRWAANSVLVPVSIIYELKIGMQWKRFSSIHSYSNSKLLLQTSLCT